MSEQTTARIPSLQFGMRTLLWLMFVITVLLLGYRLGRNSMQRGALNMGSAYQVSMETPLGEKFDARLLIQGNDTVLDALAGSNVSLLGAKHIWIERPTASGPQYLDVDYNAITLRGDVATNFQLRPGDILRISPEARAIGD